MFTLQQIAAAHSKVKSGADFPGYIQEIKELGVMFYETFVTDGHTEFSGNEKQRAVSPAKYEKLVIAEKSDAPRFIEDLKLHQQGKSDYLTFCNQCAATGIERWSVDLLKMTCTYFDKKGATILVEQIPGPK